MSAETRRASASIFGNKYFVEVVLHLEAEPLQALASEIARSVGTNPDLIKKVLTRLETAGLVKAFPRLGAGDRAPLPYEVVRSPLWRALVVSCEQVAASGCS